MKRMSRGAPSKGSPAKGNWGNWAIIENNKRNSKRVSCYCCIHCQPDKSCLVKNIYIPDVDFRYWIRCEYFDIADKYKDINLLEIVEKYKGNDYKPRNINNKKTYNISDKTAKDQAKEFLPDSSSKERYEMACQCTHFIKSSNHCRKMSDKYCTVIRNSLDRNCDIQRPYIKKDSKIINPFDLSYSSINKTSKQSTKNDFYEDNIDVYAKYQTKCLKCKLELNQPVYYFLILDKFNANSKIVEIRVRICPKCGKKHIDKDTLNSINIKVDKTKMKLVEELNPPKRKSK